MEAYLREYVPTIKDFYVGPLCNKPRDPLSPQDVVVEGKMLIVQSQDQRYLVCLGRENGNVYRDLDATTGSYKVEVQWQKPT